ncbi:MAG: hypothetical protein IPM83_15875 [Ignavibacteria bacterium]|nr:hypothetical protein [Ignavibacteria bacterium]
MFERFYRVDKDRSRRWRHGLGLAIVKHILEAHHAPIAVDSGVGGGRRYRLCWRIRCLMESSFSILYLPTLEIY